MIFRLGFIFLCLSGVLSAYSQTDSLRHELREVVVEAASVIHKSDRDLYLLSKRVREVSVNGLDLLQNMQIPSLVVNPITETIGNSSGAVQLRINGKVASVNDIKALQPEAIVRIEYHDNPGIRYNNVNAIVDYIVKNTDIGGAFMADAMYWMHKNPSGNIFGNLQINRRNSQFGVTVSDNLRNNTDIWREYHEKLNFPDGTVLIRDENPISGVYDSHQLHASFDYSYIVPQKTTFYASLDLTHTSPNTQSFYGELTSSGISEESPVYLSVGKLTPFTSPSLNLYLDQKLGRKQTLVVDISAKFIRNRSESYYEERLPANGETITDIQTAIQERNWAFGIEADYIKEWKQSRVTVGVRWNKYHNRSAYQTSDNSMFHVGRDKIYGFTEYMHRIKSVYLTAGVSIEYDNQVLKESRRENTSVKVIPNVSAVWRAEWSTLRFSGRGSSRSPMLSETNPTIQQIDNYLYQVGNPDLKGFSAWQATLKWSQNFKRINTSLQVGYWSTSDNAIAPYYYWNDASHLITTYTNGHRNSMWWWQVSASATIIPDWLSLNTTLDMTRYYTKGRDYRHTHTSWSYNGSATLSHWGFQLLFSCNRAATALSDEMLHRNESFNLVMLTYNWRDWQFGVGMFMPLGKYNQELTLLNQHYNYSQIMRSNFIERMCVMKLSYNIRWGKQKQKAQKMMEVSNEAMSSKAASR